MVRASFCFTDNIAVAILWSLWRTWDFLPGWNVKPEAWLSSYLDREWKDGPGGPGGTRSAAEMVRILWGGKMVGLNERGNAKEGKRETTNTNSRSIVNQFHIFSGFFQDRQIVQVCERIFFLTSRCRDSFLTSLFLLFFCILLICTRRGEIKDAHRDR